MVDVKSRLPPEEHTSRPWRIHAIAPDFEVLDVWALPTPGGPEDFGRLVEVMRSLDAERSSPAVHALFAIRWALGRVLGLDDAADGIDARVNSLRGRLPDDLADSPADDTANGPFRLLYTTDDEAALDIANRTMHGVMHLGWVPDGDGAYHGQMAVLVKPNGVLGTGYLAAIAPFRHLVVYPAMLRAIGSRWSQRSSLRAVVEQVDATTSVRALSTLPHVDYADCFVVDTDAAPGWTAEQWARSVLEDAPLETRVTLSSGWTALGLRTAASDPAILGWEVRRNDPQALLLGRDSRVGMPGELLFTVRPEGGLLFATFVHHRTPATRAMWAAVQRAHVRVVTGLLERARHRAARDVMESAGAG